MSRSSVFSEGDQMSDYDGSEHGGRGAGRSSRKSQFTQSKTGGILFKDNEINLVPKFQREDLADFNKNPTYQQDEFNREDKEVEQFENVKHTQRFVESLISGRYNEVKKDFDPSKQSQSQAKIVDKDGDGIVSTQELNDFEMKEQQLIWVARLSNWYNLILGLLSGMSLMQLIAIVSATDKE